MNNFLKTLDRIFDNAATQTDGSKNVKVYRIVGELVQVFWNGIKIQEYDVLLFLIRKKRKKIWMRIKSFAEACTTGALPDEVILEAQEPIMFASPATTIFVT